MNNFQVPNDGTLVVTAVDPVSVGLENDIVANDRIGGCLNPMVAGIPNDVPLDLVWRFAIGAVDDHTGIVRVVDDVVANDVVVRAVFQFDAVTL